MGSVETAEPSPAELETKMWEKDKLQHPNLIISKHKEEENCVFMYLHYHWLLVGKDFRKTLVGILSKR